ncbi:hypothetical protein F5J12DRAFT_780425 [Pisolithus orientalis]|uniref:uncharacterized protein n=1 Tax=Pisolithus orientalis TaxID=936130 RepID=UPI002224D2D4|nr:uncharacterized protein F5J12DRAFT_780425 [Pisolithus orientalis]KAI6028915.1 hypothetical protein F5J12DRAFT_780425 [Pisolithus orientalis]
MDKFLLLAVGTEGVKLWNLKTQKELTLVTYLESHGIISCAIWMKVKQAPAETLCHGTGMGYLIFMRSNTLDKHFQEICARQLGSGPEITCVAWDITQDNIVQYCSKVYCLWQEWKHLCLGLYDGNVSAAVHLKKGLFMINNAMNGFTMYHLDGAQSIRTFLTDLPPSLAIPKQVGFGEEARVVIGGSDSGCVYIFDRKTVLSYKPLWCKISVDVALFVWDHMYNSWKAPDSKPWTIIPMLQGLTGIIIEQIELGMWMMDHLCWPNQISEVKQIIGDVQARHSATGTASMSGSDGVITGSQRRLEHWKEDYAGESVIY